MDSLKEQSRALFAPSPNVKLVSAIPAYLRSVTQFWSFVVLPWPHGPPKEKRRQLYD